MVVSVVTCTTEHVCVTTVLYPYTRKITTCSVGCIIFCSDRGMFCSFPYPSNSRPYSTVSTSLFVCELRSFVTCYSCIHQTLRALDTPLWNEVSRNAEEQRILNSRLIQTSCAMKLVWQPNGWLQLILKKSLSTVVLRWCHWNFLLT